MRIITLKELNELGEGTVFAETYSNIENYSDITKKSDLMIRLSDSFSYGNKKLFNGVVDLVPSQTVKDCINNLNTEELFSWDCSSADYNDSDKFILYEKKDLIVMRDLLNAAIESFDTKKLNIDIDKLETKLN